MENLDILGNLGKIAGIAGIAVGVLFLTFRSIIQKNIFPNLTKEHAYNIIRMIILACTAIAVIGIGAWIYSGQQEKEAQQIQVRVEGKVTDVNGSSLANVEVIVQEIEGISDNTDSEGKYVLKFEGKGERDYTIEYKRNQYSGRTKKISINFDDAESQKLDDIQLASKPSSEVSDGATNDGAIPSSTDNIPASAQEANTGGTGITVYFDPEGTGCNLTIAINIGNKTYYPQSNPFTITDLPNGNYKYSITGTAQCYQGVCEVAPISEDVIDFLVALEPDLEPLMKYYTDVTIRNGNTYYMMIDTDACVVGFFDNATYQLLKGLAQ